MVRRHSRGFFGNLVVFPGGGVDPIDRSDLATTLVDGDSDDHDHRSAALRELAEETGLLAATGGMRLSPDLRGTELFEYMSSARILLAGESLILVSRWITPEFAPRRFDTRFYLLAAEETPSVRLDSEELVDYAWATPEAALDRYESGEWPMILPTLAHLRWLSRRSSISDAAASARGAGGRTLIKPKRAEDGALISINLPAES
jgi:8-oxo-dGTP pyrophosphatase MutT (NUDIX family)